MTRRLLAWAGSLALGAAFVLPVARADDAPDANASVLVTLAALK